MLLGGNEYNENEEREREKKKRKRERDIYTVAFDGKRERNHGSGCDFFSFLFRGVWRVVWYLDFSS